MKLIFLLLTICFFSSFIDAARTHAGAGGDFSTESRQNDYNALQELKNLVVGLLESGKKSIQSILNDPDVKEILDRLSSKMRKLAIKLVELIESMSILQFVSYDAAYDGLSGEDIFMLQNMDAPENRSEVKSPLQELKELVINLLKSGKEGINNIINDPKVQAVLERLGEKGKYLAIQLIRLLERLSILQLVPYDMAVAVEPEIASVDDLISLDTFYEYLEKAKKQGKAALRQFLASQTLADLLAAMPSSLRTVAQAYVDELSQSLQGEENNEETEEYVLLTEESVIGGDNNIVREIYYRLQRALSQGQDALKNFLESSELRQKVENLSGKVREAVEHILKVFTDKLEALQPESIKPQSLDFDVEELIASIRERVLEASRMGVDKVKELIGEENFQSLIKQLPEPVKSMIKGWINALASEQQN